MPQSSRSVVGSVETGVKYRFEPMSQRQARAVAAWRYDPPYDFYDAVADPEDLAELLDPVQRESRYFAVLGDPGRPRGVLHVQAGGGRRRGWAGTAPRPY